MWAESIEGEAKKAGAETEVAGTASELGTEIDIVWKKKNRVLTLW